MPEKLIILSCTLLIGIVSNIFPVQQNKVPEKLPVDTSSVWRVGFSMFIPERLSNENQYLAYSIPLILRENLVSIEEHEFSVDEKKAYRKKIVDNELMVSSVKLKQYIDARDNLFFADIAMGQRSSRLHEIEKSIKEVRERMNYLKGLDIKRIEFPDKKKIEYISSKGPGRLLDTAAFSALQLAKKRNVDLLIWGMVEQIDNILYIRIEAYDSALEKSVFSYVDAGSRENVYSYIKDAETGLSRVLLGRSWGNLIVETNPEDSSIYVNDVFKGLGNEELRYLVPGELTIRVHHDGYKDYIHRVTVEESKTSHLSVKLKEIKLGTVTINTEPEGAALYLNSVWQGVSPLSLLRPDSFKYIVIKKEGFGISDFTFSRDTPNTVTVKLQRELISPEKIERQKRDEFYSAFGLWLITLPVPIFGYGFAIDYKLGEITALTDNNTGEADKMSLYSDMMYYSYLGGIFISASLFVNVAVHLINYIESVNR